MNQASGVCPYCLASADVGCDCEKKDERKAVCSHCGMKVDYIDFEGVRFESVYCGTCTTKSLKDTAKLMKEKKIEPKPRKCKWCHKTVKESYHECDYVAMKDELYCEHGVGHGNHVHGCCQDNCCATKEWELAYNKFRKKAGRKVE